MVLRGMSLLNYNSMLSGICADYPHDTLAGMWKANLHTPPSEASD